MAVNNIGIIFLVLVLGFGGLFATLWFTGNLGTQQTFAGQNVIEDTSGKLVASDRCPSTSIDGRVSLRNPLSSTGVYYAGSVTVTDSKGSTVATGTATAGTTESLATVTIPCTPDVYNNGVYVYGTATGNLVATTGNGSVKSGLLKFDGSNSVIAKLEAPSSANFTKVVRDTALVNLSSNDVGTGVVSQSDLGNNNLTVGIAMAQGGTLTTYLDIQMEQGNSQFGSNDGGVLIGIDTDEGSVFGDNAISLSTTTGNYPLTEVKCSDYSRATSVDSLNRCYKSPPLSSSTGLVRFGVLFLADTGEPTTSTNPRIWFYDVVYAPESDGSIILNTHDKGNTNLGRANMFVNYDLS